jgi:DNA-binding NarL/FixJ family response regulator
MDVDPRFGSLSLRERQILALVADALTNREISERLKLSEKTVKNYVSKMLTKLGFDHRTQAAVFEIARRTGASDK